MSSVVRLTSNSIDGDSRPNFGNCKHSSSPRLSGGRSEIESALAGIKIIIETIVPGCARLVREQIVNPHNFVGDR